MSDRRHILGVSKGELEAWVQQNNFPKFRADQILKGIYAQGESDFAKIKGLPKDLIQKLETDFEFPLFPYEVLSSQDGTQKFKFIDSAGAFEAVWMPEEDRSTLCISSQVGCALKCAFCVTGTMGLKRNLTAAEIALQVWVIKSKLKMKLTNIVMMGMGEPLHNCDEVIESLKIMTDPDRLAVGKRKITVSTAGFVPKLKFFFQKTDVKLAISLTGFTNEQRNKWMPINQKYNLETLKKELQSIKLDEGRYFTFEVVLIKDQTDRDEDADNLIEFLTDLPAKVNLIPYNNNPWFPELKYPDQTRVHAFQAKLKNQNIPTFIRKNKGRDIQGACGQLAGQEFKKQ